MVCSGNLGICGPFEYIYKYARSLKASLRLATPSRADAADQRLPTEYLRGDTVVECYRQDEHHPHGDQGGDKAVDHREVVGLSSQLYERAMIHSMASWS